MDFDRRTLLGLAGAGLVGGAAWTTTRDAVSGATTGPDTRPATSEEHLEAFVRGNTDFGFDVLASLTDASTEANVLFSPLSIATALAMTWAGARGETESQMATTLAYSLGQDALHPAIGALQYDLNERADDMPAREIPHVWRTNRLDLTEYAL